MTEVAYYRLAFFTDTAAEFNYIEIPMTAFKARIQSKKGIDLTQYPFSEHQTHISNKYDYGHSQPLGLDMRQAGVETFLYPQREQNISVKM